MQAQFWTIDNGKLEKGETVKIDQSEYKQIAAKAVARITPPKQVFVCDWCTTTEVETKGAKCLDCVKRAADKHLRSTPPILPPGDLKLWLAIAVLCGIFIAFFVSIYWNPKPVKPVKTNKENNFQRAARRTKSGEFVDRPACAGQRA